MQKNDVLAQGTIEYLVLNVSSKISNQIGSGGINVVEGVSSIDGSGFIIAENNSNDLITLVKIAVDEDEEDYLEGTISPWSKKPININDLCVCEEGQKTKTCYFELTYKYILNNLVEQKSNQYVTIQCNSDAEPNDPIMPENCFNLNDNPIQICSLTDLNRIRENFSGNYVLMKNIDATETNTWDNGKGWKPIGTYSTRFTGKINGNRKRINGLYINRPTEDYVGLIGLAQESEIIDFGITDIDITGKNYVGGLTGQNISTNFERIFITGDLNGLNNIGGITGDNYESSITNVYARGNVSGFEYLGGIAGSNSADNLESTIEKAYAEVNITGTGYAGGIAGANIVSNISNSYSTGIINASGYGSAGLYGEDFLGTISNSYWDVNRSGKSNCCGWAPCGDCFGKNINGLEPDAFFPKLLLGGDYNVPMQKNTNQSNDWDFTNTWAKVENNYPKFIWQE